MQSIHASNSAALSVSVPSLFVASPSNPLPSQPKEIKEIKKFLETARRKDAVSNPMINPHP